MSDTAHRSFRLGVFYGGQFTLNTQVNAQIETSGGQNHLNFTINRPANRNRPGSTESYRIDSTGQFVPGEGLTVPPLEQQRAILEAARDILKNPTFTDGERRESGVTDTTLAALQGGVDAAISRTPDYRLRTRGSLPSPGRLA